MKFLKILPSSFPTFPLDAPTSLFDTQETSPEQNFRSPSVAPSPYRLWFQQLTICREGYNQLCDKHQVDLFETMSTDLLKAKPSPRKSLFETNNEQKAESEEATGWVVVCENDHPLAQEGQWAHHFVQREILEEIEKDVLRTHDEIELFKQEYIRQLLTRVMIFFKSEFRFCLL